MSGQDDFRAPPQQPTDFTGSVTDTITGSDSPFPSFAKDAIKQGIEGWNFNVNTESQNKFDFNRRTFPLDLGSNSSYNGHYMVININVQESSQLAKRNFGIGRGVSTTLTDFNSKTDVYRKQDALVVGDPAYNSIVNRPRFTKRITESIAIYMPSASLDFTDKHDYTDVSLTALGGQVGRFIISSALAFAGGALAGGAGAIAGTQAAGSIVNAFGQTVSNVSKLAGVPINPRVEVIFSNTDQRQFRFDFLMSPTSQQESESIKSIIKTLRYHAAPELRPGLVDSFFWIPPSEFDITFYNRGKENENIPRINTCVLEQIDVSYAPSGVYSTFSNGHPVQVRMQLTFRETEVVHKIRVAQGF